MVCISLLSFLFFTKHTQPYVERERSSEKGSRPTVFRRTPTFPTIAVMKNQVVAMICGLITATSFISVSKIFFSWVFGSRSNDCCFNVFVQLICSRPTLVWFVGTNGNNDVDLARTKRFNKHTWLCFFTFESYGHYEAEQSGKQLRAQLASWFYAIIGIEEDGIFVSNGAQFHISCLQLQGRRKIHHGLYMLTFPLIVLVVRASMVRQPLLKPAVLHAFLMTVLRLVHGWWFGSGFGSEHAIVSTGLIDLVGLDM
ncbi:putative LL-diaminopimelate aminotransferase [Helianthus anomalus]